MWKEQEQGCIWRMSTTVCPRCSMFNPIVFDTPDSLGVCGGIGTLPSTYRNLTNLKVFDMGLNRLTGMPCMYKLSVVMFFLERVP
jgi:hypothetical protein